MKSKIHLAMVTETNLNYIGSVTIDEVLMESSDLLENKRLQIVNNNNGARLETYVYFGAARQRHHLSQQGSARQVHATVR